MNQRALEGGRVTVVTRLTADRVAFVGGTCPSPKGDPVPARFPYWRSDSSRIGWAGLRPWPTIQTRATATRRRHPSLACKAHGTSTPLYPNELVVSSDHSGRTCADIEPISKQRLIVSRRPARGYHSQETHDKLDPILHPTDSLTVRRIRRTSAGTTARGIIPQLRGNFGERVAGADRGPVPRP